MSTPSFPSEIFGMFIESLGEDPDDQQFLFACSLVSSVFRHLCGPILYQGIVLDREEKVDDFIQFGERSECLQYVKSFTLIDLKGPSQRPHIILATILRKASLEILRLHQVFFYAESLTAPLLSRLSTTVTMLVLRECRFGEFEGFVSFIRRFPLCEVLRLRGCTWMIRRGEDAKPKFGSLPAYDIAPVHLEVANTFISQWGEECCDQGEILGTAWLGLAGLKSFTYAIGGEARSELALGKVTGCELLEEIDVAISYSVRRDFGECESSPPSFHPELGELIEISDRPVNHLRRSYQIPHHQV